MIVLQTLLACLAVYLTFYSFYWLCLTLLGLPSRSSNFSDSLSTSPEILLILPAYKPGERFLDVLDSLPKAIQKRNIKVLVLLQDADEKYYHYSVTKGFICIQKSFSHLSGNSYQHALRFITQWIDKQRLRGTCNPEFVMLVDKDNVIAPDRQVRATFLPQCIVTEEKTNNISNHNPQRIRWFGEQYYNAIHHSGTLLRAAFQFRRPAALDYLITLCRPPRSIQVVISPILCFGECVYFWATSAWPIGIPLFSISWLLLSVALVVFLLHENALLKATLSIGSLVKLAYFNLFNAVKSVRAENKGKFIHTTHHL